MPFHAAHPRHGQRLASGTWLGSCSVVPSPSPQLQHRSSSYSLRCEQTRQTQSARRAPERNAWCRPHANPPRQERKRATVAIATESMGGRSEERRVGKERRTGGVSEAESK